MPKSEGPAGKGGVAQRWPEALAQGHRRSCRPPEREQEAQGDEDVDPAVAKGSYHTDQLLASELKNIFRSFHEHVWGEVPDVF